MAFEGLAAIAAVGFAVLSSVVAVAISFGANRARLARLERDIHDATDVKADVRQIKTVLFFLAQQLGVVLPPMGDD